MPEDTPLPVHVDQAIDWLVQRRFGELDAVRERQFQHWLLDDPRHALAWERVAGLGDEFATLPSTLSRRTLDGQRRLQGSRREHLKLMATLAIGGGLLWGVREPLGLPTLLADSRTGTGERRTLLGSDGSRIQLDTASAIDLRYSPEQRQLTLLQGQLSLATNAQDHRPFRILTRLGVLTTDNAELLLGEREGGLRLAVRHGELILSGPGLPARSVHAGEVLQLRPGAAPQPAELHGDPWGWTEGVLSVQQMPLGEFVAELSRYRPGLIRCDERVAGLKVSGTFQLDDSDQILRLLARSLPVQVAYRTRYWVSIDARDAA